MCERRESSGCSHLRNYKSSKGTSDFELIISNLVLPHFDKKYEYYEKIKVLTSKCHQLNCYSICLLHTCLFCSTILCYDKHIKGHAQQTGHNIAVDINYGNVYCFICATYVYDDEFLTIVDMLKQLSCSYLGFSYTPLTDIPLIKADINSVVSACASQDLTRVTSRSHIGIRGLVNHGKTCFINCVLQAFAHVPLIRNYFFSTNHECKYRHNCFLCIIENLFQEFYNGKTEPISIGPLIPLVWERTPHLAKDMQHDTHEFFIAALNFFHEDCIDSDSQNCSCIAHKIFTGQLQSNLICDNCKTVSTKVDPFWDISLEIRRSCQEKQHQLTLEECIKQYTESECLVQINCTNCNFEEDGNFTKQMTFKSLPHVLFLQLKRFETIKKKDILIKKKISNKITFPSILDFTKFRSDYESNNTADSFLDINLDDNRFSLSAVICHTGLCPESGHYTSYISQCGNWFECDDEEITYSTLDDVLNSEAYLLVYEKINPEYSLTNFS